MLLSNHSLNDGAGEKAILPPKYQKIYVGRIVRKVQDGQEITGVVQHLDLVRYNSNVPKENRVQRSYKVYWDGEAGTEVITEEDLQQIVTQRFTEASWLVPEIAERQKVGWDETKLDQEDLRLKQVMSQAISNHSINRKAALEAAFTVSALRGKRYEPPEPQLMPTYGQPVDPTQVPMVCPPNNYRLMKKQNFNSTKKGEPHNDKYKAHLYDAVLDAGVARAEPEAEVVAEAIQVMMAKVAFVEILKQAKEAAKRKKLLLELAIKRENGEDEPAEESDGDADGEPRPAKPAPKKLDTEEIRKQLEVADARVSQAAVDAEAAKKAARDFEERHGLVVPKSKPAVGLKSRAKANAQPSKATKPKEAAAGKEADKGKGRAEPAKRKKTPFGQASARAAQKQGTVAGRRAAAVAARKAAAAAGADAAATANMVAGAADPNAPGPSAGPFRAAAAAAPASPAAAAAAKKAEKRPAAGAAAAKPRKKAAVAAKAEEVQERSQTPSFNLNLSEALETDGNTAASDDPVIVLDTASNGAARGKAAAGKAGTKKQPQGTVASSEADQAGPSRADNGKGEMRVFPDGRAYPENLCLMPGDMPLDEWSEKEARNELPKDTDYNVIAILDERKKKGKREFVVKWEGFELHPYQWFPLQLFEECEALEHWEREHPQPPKSAKKRKRPRRE